MLGARHAYRRTVVPCDRCRPAHAAARRLDLTALDTAVRCLREPSQTRTRTRAVQTSDSNSSDPGLPGMHIHMAPVAHGRRHPRWIRIPSLDQTSSWAGVGVLVASDVALGRGRRERGAVVRGPRDTRRRQRAQATRCGDTTDTACVSVQRSSVPVRDVVAR